MTLSLTYQGFNYPAYYNGAYENADSLPSLVATGANSVAFDLDYGIDVDNSTVYADQNYTDSLTALGDMIAQATADGLSVMVRPLIDFLEPSLIGSYSVGDWRSFYDPTNIASFFSSYQSMIVAEAKVAQANGATTFCIGAELDQLTGPQYLGYWTNIISAVRAVFSGKLTYSADWDDDISPWAGENGLPAGTGNLATQVSFWNQLDYIGIDCYAPISDATNPTLTQLIDGWTQVPTDPTSLAVTGDQSLISYFQNLSAELGKPLMFTELGYESATDAASQPSGSSTNVFDPSLQAELYQAFFDAWGEDGNGSLAGLYFWNWDPNASEVGLGNGANFSPQGLPAQTVVTDNFDSAPALINDTTIGVQTGSTVTLPESALRFDDVVSSHAQETYTITSAPQDGTLLLNGVATSSFTQAEIDAGEVSYHETAGGVSSDSFSFTVTNAAGNTTAVEQFNILIAPTSADFNGNGTSDILWHNLNNGLNLIWNIQDDQYEGGPNLPATTPDWTIAAIGDFAGNGTSDILWHNLNSGENLIWNIQNGQYEGGPTLPSMSNSWEVAGVGDFQGNGASDILWHNTSTGQNEIWNIQNSQFVSSVNLPTTTLNWQIAGVGDFEGNGTDDILWHNTNNGLNLIWNIQDDQYEGGPNLPSTTLDWTIAAVGDFAGTGTDDILWYNLNSGENLIWNIQDEQYEGGPTLPSMSSSWQVVGVGDFQGNGASDVLWHNTSTGQNQIWNIASSQFVSSANLPTTTLDWQMLV